MNWGIITLLALIQATHSSDVVLETGLTFSSPPELDFATGKETDVGKALGGMNYGESPFEMDPIWDVEKDTMIDHIPEPEKEVAKSNVEPSLPKEQVAEDFDGSRDGSLMDSKTGAEVGTYPNEETLLAAEKEKPYALGPDADKLLPPTEEEKEEADLGGPLEGVVWTWDDANNVEADTYDQKTVEEGDAELLRLHAPAAAEPEAAVAGEEELRAELAEQDAAAQPREEPTAAGEHAMDEATLVEAGTYATDEDLAKDEQFVHETADSVTDEEESAVGAVAEAKYPNMPEEEEPRTFTDLTEELMPEAKVSEEMESPEFEDEVGKDAPVEPLDGEVPVGLPDSRLDSQTERACGKEYFVHFNTHGDKTLNTNGWYDFALGPYKVRLHGWSHTRGYANGFLCNGHGGCAGRMRMQVENLEYNQQFEYKVYSLSIKGHYTAMNRFRIETVDEPWRWIENVRWPRNCQRRNACPYAAKGIVRTLRGPLTFRWHKDAQHVHLSGFSIRRYCGPKFSATLGGKQGVSQKTYMFQVVTTTVHGGDFKERMRKECNQIGMKPVCDHRSYCKHDYNTLYIGQDHHLCYKPHREHKGYMPHGFHHIRHYWERTCCYTAGHGGHRALCNIPTNTHAWRGIQESGANSFVCGIVAPFSITLQSRGGAHERVYEFMMLQTDRYGGSYEQHMREQCTKVGMKPVCDHPSYCKTDVRSVYLGNAHHIAYPGHRNHNGYFPHNWRYIRHNWDWACTFTGGHGGSNNLCNIPYNTHSWRGATEYSGMFMCARAWRPDPIFRSLAARNGVPARRWEFQLVHVDWTQGNIKDAMQYECGRINMKPLCDHPHYCRNDRRSYYIGQNHHMAYPGHRNDKRYWPEGWMAIRDYWEGTCAFTAHHGGSNALCNVPLNTHSWKNIYQGGTMTHGGATSFVCAQVAKFSARLGGKNGVPARPLEFQVVATSMRGHFQHIMLTECANVGMKPVCDHPHYCRSAGHTHSIYIGQTHHIAYPGHRNNANYFPSGWTEIKDQWQGLCSYTAHHGNPRALCNLPSNTHSWQHAGSTTNQFMCANVAPFTATLGSKNGVPRSTYEFQSVVWNKNWAWGYSAIMLQACREIGMKPVCDHPSYCKHDPKAIYLGQDHHISHPSHRNNQGFFPTGWADIKDNWYQMCVYTANHGHNGHTALCNINPNSHSWQHMNWHSNMFICGKRTGFQATLGERRGMPKRRLDFKIVQTELRGGRFNHAITSECAKIGMKPLCDHRSYCQNDPQAIYIGQDHHVAYKPHRDHNGYWPEGFKAIKDQFDGVCVYTAGHGTGALCNIPRNSHSWRHPSPGADTFPCVRVAPFEVTFGPKNGVPERKYEFRIVTTAVRGGNFSPLMRKECRRYGMKPVCDHPSYCRKDPKAIYIGQDHHIAYAGHRKDNKYFPSGWSQVKNNMHGICMYTGREKALCNFPYNTHSWRAVSDSFNTFLCGRVAEFRQKLGAKNGVPARDYTFSILQTDTRHKRFSDVMVKECRALGMKPVCDHPHYCKSDSNAIYVGQTHHIGYPPHRNKDDFFPSGWSRIKEIWDGLCVYTGKHGSGALCNIPRNSHSWQTISDNANRFACGRISDFTGKLGSRNGVPAKTYEFHVVSTSIRSGKFTEAQIDECQKFGMKPVCDHRNYCRNDRNSIYLGQDHHLAYPNHRNHGGYWPSGWSAIKGHWDGLCTYTAHHGPAGHTLCNVPANTHSWQKLSDTSNTFVCARVVEGDLDEAPKSDLSDWRKGGEVSIKGSDATLQKGGWLESRKPVFRPVTVSADIKAFPNIGCISMTLFSHRRHQHDGLGIETGINNQNARVTPDNKQLRMGGNDHWHKVKIEAEKNGLTRFYVDGNFIHETKNRADRTSGHVNFFATCRGMKVRNVRVDAGDSKAARNTQLYLGCADTRKRKTWKWRGMGQMTDPNACRKKCKGYRYMSLECPTTDGKGFHCFCANHWGEKIPDLNCEGDPSASKWLGGGKNHNCAGASYWGGYRAGGWHRGAMYDLHVKQNQCGAKLKEFENTLQKEAKRRWDTGAAKHKQCRRWVQDHLKAIKKHQKDERDKSSKSRTCARERDVMKRQRDHNKSRMSRFKRERDTAEKEQKAAQKSRDDWRNRANKWKKIRDGMKKEKENAHGKHAREGKECESLRQKREKRWNARWKKIEASWKGKMHKASLAFKKRQDFWKAKFGTLKDRAKALKANRDKMDKLRAALKAKTRRCWEGYRVRERHWSRKVRDFEDDMSRKVKAVHMKDMQKEREWRKKVQASREEYGRKIRKCLKTGHNEIKKCKAETAKQSKARAGKYGAWKKKEEGKYKTALGKSDAEQKKLRSDREACEKKAGEEKLAHAKKIRDCKAKRDGVKEKRNKYKDTIEAEKRSEATAKRLTGQLKGRIRGLEKEATTCEVELKHREKFHTDRHKKLSDEHAELRRQSKKCDSNLKNLKYLHTNYNNLFNKVRAHAKQLIAQRNEARDDIRERRQKYEAYRKKCGDLEEDWRKRYNIKDEMEEKYRRQYRDAQGRLTSLDEQLRELDLREKQLKRKIGESDEEYKARITSLQKQWEEELAKEKREKELKEERWKKHAARLKQRSHESKEDFEKRLAREKRRFHEEEAQIERKWKRISALITKKEHETEAEFRKRLQRMKDKHREMSKYVNRYMREKGLHKKDVARLEAQLKGQMTAEHKRFFRAHAALRRLHARIGDAHDARVKKTEAARKAKTSYFLEHKDALLTKHRREQEEHFWSAHVDRMKQEEESLRKRYGHDKAEFQKRMAALKAGAERQRLSQVKYWKKMIEATTSPEEKERIRKHIDNLLEKKYRKRLVSMAEADKKLKALEDKKLQELRALILRAKRRLKLKLKAQLAKGEISKQEYDKRIKEHHDEIMKQCSTQEKLLCDENKKLVGAMKVQDMKILKLRREWATRDAALIQDIKDKHQDNQLRIDQLTHLAMHLFSQLSERGVEVGSIGDLLHQKTST